MAELYPVYMHEFGVVAVCSQLSNAQALRDKINAGGPDWGPDAAWTGDAVLFNPSHADTLAMLANRGWSPRS